MTPTEVAEVLGCAVTHVRWLIRHKRLPATQVPSKTNRYGYVYDIAESDVAQYQEFIQTRNPRPGFPLGKSRS